MAGFWGWEGSWALIYTQRNGQKAIAGSQEDSDYTRSLFGFSMNKKYVCPMGICNIFFLRAEQSILATKKKLV